MFNTQFQEKLKKKWNKSSVIFNQIYRLVELICSFGILNLCILIIILLDNFKIFSDPNVLKPHPSNVKNRMNSQIIH